MSNERRLREIVKGLVHSCAALDADPDVVAVAKVLRQHKVEPPKYRDEKWYKEGWKDAVSAVADNLERKFKFRLTDDGWKWTDA